MEAEHSALLDAAARPYASAGWFASRFAREKLRRDPMYRGLLALGCLPGRGRLVDLGCGRGLLLSLLAAARERHQRGDWPAAWAPPPSLELEGFELEAAHAAVAQRALGARARITQCDVRTSKPPPCAAVALLDVLLYQREEDQLIVLANAVAALEPGGVLLVREADAAAGPAFRWTRWSEQLLQAARGRLDGGLHYRSAERWAALLASFGLAVRVEPMSAGTPFANVLFVCRKPIS